MPSLGPAEILVILVIALLVFGPNKMPEIARQVGRGMREFRRVQQHLSGELRDVVSEFDTKATEPDAADVPDVADVADRSHGAVTAVPDAASSPTGFTELGSTPNPTVDPVDRGQRVWPPPPTAHA